MTTKFRRGRSDRPWSVLQVSVRRWAFGGSQVTQLCASGRCASAEVVCQGRPAVTDVFLTFDFIFQLVVVLSHFDAFQALSIQLNGQDHDKIFFNFLRVIARLRFDGMCVVDLCHYRRLPITP